MDQPNLEPFAQGGLPMDDKPAMSRMFPAAGAELDSAVAAARMLHQAPAGSRLAGLSARAGAGPPKMAGQNGGQLPPGFDFQNGARHAPGQPSLSVLPDEMARLALGHDGGRERHGGDGLHPSPGAALDALGRFTDPNGYQAQLEQRGMLQEPSPASAHFSDMGRAGAYGAGMPLDAVNASAYGPAKSGSRLAKLFGDGRGHGASPSMSGSVDLGNYPQAGMNRHELERNISIGGDDRGVELLAMLNGAQQVGLRIYPSMLSAERV
jgi:hypothetical protein